MALRTLVSFEADDVSFPPDGGPPPGRELAQFVSDALTRAGLEHDPPEEREGWAWDLSASRGPTQIQCIVGLTDDPPVQWQIHSHVRTSRLKKVFGLGAQTDSEPFVREWVEAIHVALKSDGRFRSIRWYDEQDFERDHGESFAERPTD